MLLTYTRGRITINIIRAVTITKGTHIMTEEFRKQILDHFKIQVHTAKTLSIIKCTSEAYTYACAYCAPLIKFNGLDIETMQAIYDIARDEFKVTKG